MKIAVEIDEKELRLLVVAQIQRIMGDVDVKPEDVKIEVKSKQNFRSEWEPADFRATVEKRQ